MISIYNVYSILVSHEKWNGKAAELAAKPLIYIKGMLYKDYLYTDNKLDM